MAKPGSSRRRSQYRLWAPFYDGFAAVFASSRRRSLAGLELRPGDRLLIVGAGTGLDLPLVPDGVRTLATDFTPAMLSRARQRRRPGQALALMDAQSLGFGGATFDAALLHLVLSVVDDPAACLRETSRVLRPGGRVAVLDKFVPDGGRPSRLRRAASLVTDGLGTDLTRRLGDIVRASGAPLRVMVDEPVLLGLYRLVRLSRA